MGIKIAIRMDDITSHMNWENFERFKALLDQFQICPLIGVVPHCQDHNLAKGKEREDFWDYIYRLQTEKGWVIAQHGYEHVYDSKQGGIFPLNHFSEFAGHSAEEQKAKIQKGRQILQEKNIQTNLFMAPAHGFDKITLQVLQEEGFLYITDGFGKAPYSRDGIIFLPIAANAKKDILKTEGFTTLVVHTNTMGEESFLYYENLFASYKDQFIPYGVLLTIPAKRRSKLGNWSEFLMAKSKFYIVKCLASR